MLQDMLSDVELCSSLCLCWCGWLTDVVSSHSVTQTVVIKNTSKIGLMLLTITNVC